MERKCLTRCKNTCNVKTMMKAKIHTNDEDTRIIKKYSKPVLDLLRDFAQQRQLSRICREKLNGMKSSRLTELHTGARPLTSYYLGKLLQGEVVTIDQILQGKKLKDLPIEDQRVLRKMALDDESIDLIGEYAARS